MVHRKIEDYREGSTRDKDHQYLTWDDFNDAVTAMLKTMSEQIDQGKLPKLQGIYGMPRGGLPLAVALSNMLNLPLLMAPIEKCLIVDDIFDTGRQAMPWIRRYVLHNRAIIMFWYCNVSRLKDHVTHALDNIFWTQPTLKKEHYHFPWEHLHEEDEDATS